MRVHQLNITAILLVVMLHVADIVAFAPHCRTPKVKTLRSPRNVLRAEAERRPWNLFKFVEQAATFNNPFSRPSSESRRVLPGDVLWKAGSLTNEFTFGPLDDVIMGGASLSSFNEATGKWKGDVTDANNGGFIGIRSTPVFNYDLSQCQGLEIKVSTSPSQKNGLRLKVGVRDSAEFNGIIWNNSFDVTGRKSVKMPFQKLVPTLFAKTVSDQTFATDNVQAVQLTFSKFEYDGGKNPTFEVGDFELQVEKISVY